MMYTRQYAALRLAVLLMITCGGVCSPRRAVAQGDDAAGMVTGEAASGTVDETATRSERKTFVIPLSGPIQPNLLGFIERQFSAARAAGAEVVVLDIDSPGGRLDTTLEISSLLTEEEGIETVAYVRRTAYSGAALIALSCDRIDMHPDALIGDVGVIEGGAFSPFRYVEEKQRSPVVATMRRLAERRQRPPALAEAMVDKDAVVYEAKNRDSGQTRYFTEQAWESFPDQAEWERGAMVLESREGQFLTINGERAFALGLVEGNSRSLDDALTAVGAARPARVLNWTWIDTTIVTLNSWWVAALLILIGLIALLVELSAPGLGVGGLVSLLCFALFFWSRFLGGTAGWLEVTLFLTALAFIAAEFFVIPGFGVAGISGVVLLVLSLVMASQRVLFPQTGADWSVLGTNLLTVCLAICGVFVFLFMAADSLGRLPMLKRLILEPPTSRGSQTTLASGKKPAEVPVGERIGVGDLGRTVSPLRPSGKAQFADDVIDVSTEGEFIATDTPVRVFRKQSGRIVVREA